MGLFFFAQRVRSRFRRILLRLRFPNRPGISDHHDTE